MYVGRDSFQPGWAQIAAGLAQARAGGAEPPVTHHFNHLAADVRTHRARFSPLMVTQ